MLGLFGSKTKALIIVDVQNDFAPGDEEKAFAEMRVSGVTVK